MSEADFYRQFDEHTREIRNSLDAARDFFPDPEPTGTSSGGSEEERILRAQQERRSKVPIVQQRTFCWHLQPCKECNPAAASVVAPTVAVERAASTRTKAVAPTSPAATPAAVARSSSPAVDSVDALVASLSTCKTDAERVTLITAAPYEMRQRLQSHLRYHGFMDETAREVKTLERDLAAFTQSLEDAPDDTARLAIIVAAPPTLLSEWQRYSTASGEDWRKHYMQAAGIV